MRLAGFGMQSIGSQVAIRPTETQKQRTCAVRRPAPGLAISARSTQNTGHFFRQSQGFPVTPASRGQEGKVMNRPIVLVPTPRLPAVPRLWAQDPTAKIYG